MDFNPLQITAVILVIIAVTLSFSLLVKQGHRAK